MRERPSVILGREDHVGDESQPPNRILSPYARVLLVVNVVNQQNIRVRMNLTQPGRAQFARGELTGFLAHDHAQFIHARAGKIDQVFVSTVWGVEFAHNQPASRHLEFPRCNSA
jgi:hypothetical protein